MPSEARYSEKQLRTARNVVLAAWIFGVLSFFPPLVAMSIGGLGRAIFWLLAVAHAVEYAFFYKTYAAAGGSALRHFMRHMVYGVIYKTEIEQRSARG